MNLEDLPEPDFEGNLPVDELHVDGENPNEMQDETFGLLCDRLKERGWVGGPIVVNAGDLPDFEGETETDGLIADGEHRWRAAREIGLEEVPVLKIDFKDDAERRLYRQELNKIEGRHDRKRDAMDYDAILGGGRREGLQDLVDATGEDLDEILSELERDRGMPPNYEYSTDHNVHFQDCVEGMQEHLADDSVDMVFTSPPYNVDHDPREGMWSGKQDAVPYDDDMTDDEYEEFLRDVLEECSRVLKPGGHLFFNIQLDLMDGDVTCIDWVDRICPMKWSSFVVWSKGIIPAGSAGFQHRGRFAQTWEPVLHFTHDDPWRLNGTRNFAVWEVRPTNFEAHDTGKHPAPFPVDLVKKAMFATTDPGDLILDPFMGSGTTAVAAIEEDREYIGFELDEDDVYAPTIERRIQEALAEHQTTDGDGEEPAAAEED